MTNTPTYYLHIIYHHNNHNSRHRRIAVRLKMISQVRLSQKAPPPPVHRSYLTKTVCINWRVA